MVKTIWARVFCLASYIYSYTMRVYAILTLTSNDQDSQRGTKRKEEEQRGRWRRNREGGVEKRLEEVQRVRRRDKEKRWSRASNGQRYPCPTVCTFW